MEVRLAVGTKQEGETCMIPRNLSVLDVLMSLLHRLVTECSDVSCALVLHVVVSLVLRLVTCMFLFLLHTGELLVCSDISCIQVGYLYVRTSLVLGLFTCVF